MAKETEENFGDCWVGYGASYLAISKCYVDILDFVEYVGIHAGCSVG
jgi:hypothetical protein